MIRKKAQLIKRLISLSLILIFNLPTLSLFDIKVGNLFVIPKFTIENKAGTAKAQEISSDEFKTVDTLPEGAVSYERIGLTKNLMEQTTCTTSNRPTKSCGAGTTIEYQDVLLSANSPGMTVGVRGETFEMASVTLNLKQNDDIYLSSFPTASQATGGCHATDDLLSISTSRGGVFSKSYEVSCMYIQPQSAPINLSKYFISAGQTAVQAGSVSVNADFKDSCGVSESHTPYYLNIVRCKTLPPTISSISPANSIIGATITIYGSNFTGATSVKFGTTNATSFTVVSASRITAVVPNGTDTKAVTVTNSGGTSNSKDFTYKPLVTSISPGSGSKDSTITINGANFNNITAVKFGGTNATSFEVVSSTRITAVVPNRSGTVAVTVVGSAGTSNNDKTFSYGPVISSISPTAGLIGSTLTINGSSFTGATSVKFGTTNATSFEIISASKITAVVPNGTDTKAVTVTTSAGTSNSKDFTYKPLITSISPENGSKDSTITINGSNFNNITAVKFGGTNATSFEVVSSTRITAVVPNRSGTVAVTVVGSAGTSNNDKTFTYGPVISSISPANGLAGTAITINGSSFNGATSVKFGNTSVDSFTVVSAAKITTVIPNGTDTKAVTVTTSAGTSNSKDFTYKPLITSVSPGNGTLGSSIDITGTSFRNATAVKFGSTNATSFEVSTNGTNSVATAIVPRGSGTVNITVVTGAGTSNTASFTYRPIIDNISPTTGASNSTVTINGLNFSNISGVKFGSTTATYTVNSTSKITAMAPAGSGTQAVTVTNNLGTSNSINFAYSSTSSTSSSSGSNSSSGSTCDSIVSSNLSLPDVPGLITSAYNPDTNKVYLFGQNLNQINEYSPVDGSINSKLADNNVPISGGVIGSSPVSADNAVWDPINKKFYFLGYTFLGNSITGSRIFQYDPATNVLSIKVFNLPYPYSNYYQGATAVYNPDKNKFYFIGGYIIGLGADVNYILELDASSSTVAIKTPRFPQGLNKATAVWDNDLKRVYTFGGYLGGANTNTIFEYNPDADTISSKASLPIAGRRFATVYSPVHKRAYVFGGTIATGSGYSEQTFEFNPANNTTTTRRNVPLGDSNSEAIWNSNNNNVYLFATNNTNMVFKYTPCPSTTTSSTSSSSSGSTSSSSGSTGNCTVGTVTEYDTPTTKRNPYGITNGPDGNLWFTKINAVGKITTNGTVTEYNLTSNATGITTGPDGNLWFTENQGNKIGKITPAGTLTEYNIPTADSNPYGITTGPDGNLWFTESGRSKIGKITTNGTITEYNISSSAIDITTGPDGNLWFAESQGNKVGKITTAGTVTEYNIPTAQSLPQGITTGPDGNLWFTEHNGDKIGKITTAGTITEYNAPTNSNPLEITTGPDGNLWFTEHTANKIGRITTNGTVTEYNIPTVNASLQVITAGPDGNLWFTEYNTNKIGKITSCASGSMSSTSSSSSGSTSSSSGNCTTGTFTEFNIPTANSGSNNTTKESDGNVWFTEYLGNKVGKITPSGTITEYNIPTTNSLPTGITAGPDSNIWFTELGGNKIGRITPTGTFTEFNIPTASSQPFDITSGSDGNLWFTEMTGNKIGKITPTGTVTEFTIPTAMGFPTNITSGPDGNIWFSEPTVNKIGKITPTGTITEYNIPTANSGPGSITTGSDNNIWFTEIDGNKIGKITTAGIFTEFNIPTTDSQPTGITAGADSNLWFTESSGNKIGRITSAGTITEYNVPTANSAPATITKGSDNNLWFTEYRGNKIGKITTCASGTSTTSSSSSGCLQYQQYSTTLYTWNGSSWTPTASGNTLLCCPTGQTYRSPSIPGTSVGETRNGSCQLVTCPLPACASPPVGCMYVSNSEINGTTGCPLYLCGQLVCSSSGGACSSGLSFVPVPSNYNSPIKNLCTSGTIALKGKRCDDVGGDIIDLPTGYADTYSTNNCSDVTSTSYVKWEGFYCSCTSNSSSSGGASLTTAKITEIYQGPIFKKLVDPEFLKFAGGDDFTINGFIDPERFDLNSVQVCFRNDTKCATSVTVSSDGKTIRGTSPEVPANGEQISDEDLLLTATPLANAGRPLSNTSTYKDVIPFKNIIVFMDTTPPDITVLAPTNNSYLNNRTVSLDVMIDGTGSQVGAVTINDSPASTMSTNDPNVVRVTTNLSFDNDGRQDIKIKALDAGGNSSEKTITVFIDTANPTATGSLSSDGSGRFRLSLMTNGTGSPIDQITVNDQDLSFTSQEEVTIDTTINSGFANIVVKDKAGNRFTGVMKASDPPSTGACSNDTKPLLSIDKLQSVIIHEKTSGVNKVVFDKASTKLLEDLSESTTLFDFSTNDSEYYDVFISDENGAVTDDGSYITVQCLTNINNTNENTGNNIDAIELKLTDGTSVYADKVAGVITGSGLSGEFERTKGHADWALDRPDQFASSLGDMSSSITLGFCSSLGGLINPEITITSPTNNSVINTRTVNVAGSIKGYFSRIRSGTLMLDTNTAQSLTLNESDNDRFISTFEKTLQSVEDGSHTVLIKGMDNKGNTGESTLSFTVDSSAPEITSGSVTQDSNDFLASFISSDALSNISSISIKDSLGNSITSVIDNSSPTMATLDLSMLDPSMSFNISFNNPDSMFVITLTDSLGNASGEINLGLNGTSNFSIELDKDPNLDSTLKSQSFTLMGSITSSLVNINKSSIKLKLDDNSSIDISNACEFESLDGVVNKKKILFSKPVNFNTDGAHSFTISGKDSANPANSFSFDKSINIDSAAPEINGTISTSANNESKFTVDIIVSDVSGISSIKLGSTEYTNFMTGDTSVHITQDIDTTTISIVASDIYGNTSSKPFDATGGNPDGPSVTIETPSNSDFISGEALKFKVLAEGQALKSMDSVLIELTNSENTKVKEETFGLNIDGQMGSVMNELEIPGLPDGAYSFKASVTNKFNITNSQSVNITLDNTPPEISGIFKTTGTNSYTLKTEIKDNFKVLDTILINGSPVTFENGEVVNIEQVLNVALVNVSATDKAGNTTIKTIKVSDTPIVGPCPDTTKPFVSNSTFDSIIIHEKTNGVINKFTFKKNDPVLFKDIEEGQDAFDFSTSDKEYYDIFISDENGALAEDGSYITVQAFTDGNNTNEQSGNNIDAIEIKLADGTSIYTDKIVALMAGNDLSGDYADTVGHADWAIFDPDKFVTDLGNQNSFITLGICNSLGGGVAPEIKVTSPKDSETVNSRKLKVKGTAKGFFSKIKEVKLKIDGEAGIPADLAPGGGDTLSARANLNQVSDNQFLVDFTKDIDIASDGTHTLTVIGKDNKNNISEVKVDFTVDTTGPQVSGEVTLSANDESKFTFNGKVEDISGIDSIEINEVSFTEFTKGDKEVTLSGDFDTSDIKVTAKDTLGNSSTTTFKLNSGGESTAPTITLIKPENPEVVNVASNGVLNFDVDITGKALKSMDALSITLSDPDSNIVFDKTYNITVNGENAVFKKGIDVSSVNDGTYSAKVTVTDRLNKKRFAGVTVIKDTVEPSIQGNTDPGQLTLTLADSNGLKDFNIDNKSILDFPNFKVGDKQFSATISVVGEIDIETTDIYNNKSKQSFTIPDAISSTSSSTSSSSSSSGDSNNSSSSSSSSGDNNSSSSGGNSGPGDNDPPVINLESPVDNQYYNSRNVLLGGSIVDDSEISSFTANGESIPLNKVSDRINMFSRIANFDSDGDKIIDFIAIDSFNNSSSKKVQFSVDTQNPTIDFTAKQTGPNEITVSGSANGTGSPVFSVTLNDDVLSITPTDGEKPDEIVTFNRKISFDDFPIMIKAVDKAGNIGKETLAGVDKQAPVVTILQPQNGAVITSDTVDLVIRVTHPDPNRQLRGLTLNNRDYKEKFTKTTGTIASETTSTYPFTPFPPFPPESSFSDGSSFPTGSPSSDESQLPAGSPSPNESPSPDESESSGESHIGNRENVRFESFGNTYTTTISLLNGNNLLSVGAEDDFGNQALNSITITYSPSSSSSSSSSGSTTSSTSSSSSSSSSGNTEIIINIPPNEDIIGSYLNENPPGEPLVYLPTTNTIEITPIPIQLTDIGRIFNIPDVPGLQIKQEENSSIEIPANCSFATEIRPRDGKLIIENSLLDERFATILVDKSGRTFVVGFAFFSELDPISEELIFESQSGKPLTLVTSISIPKSAVNGPASLAVLSDRDTIVSVPLIIDSETLVFTGKKNRLAKNPTIKDPIRAKIKRIDKPSPKLVVSVKVKNIIGRFANINSVPTKANRNGYLTNLNYVPKQGIEQQRLKLIQDENNNKKVILRSEINTNIKPGLRLFNIATPKCADIGAVEIPEKLVKGRVKSSNRAVDLILERLILERVNQGSNP